jgi:hypothetical protein
MTLADSRSALNDLVTALTALQLPSPFTGAAFEKVQIFDLQDLLAAMQELYAYGNRIALIGLDAIEHQCTVSGRSLKIDRSLSVTVLIADRRFNDRQKAMMGDNTTPGALYLQKLVVDAVAGELSGGWVAQPGTGRLVLLQDEKRKDETGRILFAQDLRIAVDWDAAKLSRAAKVAPSE